MGLKEGTKCLQTKQDIHKSIKMALTQGGGGRGITGMEHLLQIEIAFTLNTCQ